MFSIHLRVHETMNPMKKAHWECIVFIKPNNYIKVSQFRWYQTLYF